MAVIVCSANLCKTFKRKTGLSHIKNFYDPISCTIDQIRQPIRCMQSKMGNKASRTSSEIAANTVISSFLSNIALAVNRALSLASKNY